ncbi:MAG: DUF2461 domain-containing protein [Boseongicola sp.]|nr:DUF2461 domain-containing protein [Boseongicola sp.]MDD9977126.1 DUF2461 domain-containing protein [Boseongicola sp.]
MLFSKQTFSFLKDIAANNSKDWFDENRDRYEAHWKTPAFNFIDAIADEMRSLEPSLKAEARLNGSLRRINRDVRFSTDKSPYNARLHLVFWSGGHPNRSPGMHFVLSPDGVGYGAGQFGIEPKNLTRFRDRIHDEQDGNALIEALNEAATVGCQFGEPDLARVPKGFDADHPRSDLLRYKSYVARTHDTQAAAGNIIGPDAVDWAMEVTRKLVPLLQWLVKT